MNTSKNVETKTSETVKRTTKATRNAARTTKKPSRDSSKSKSYKDRILASGMPEYAEKATLEEALRLEEGCHDASHAREHLDFVLALPWRRDSAPEIDLRRVRQVLDERLSGLEKVKDEIVQRLAVMKLKGEKQGSVLLLVGPPGVGKTLLGESIACALDRECITLNLVGIHDEAEIHGHRRHDMGPAPGRILQALKKSGASNPVIVVEGIDELGVGGLSCDPSAALLEVLDPDFNAEFFDKYLNVPFDLSDVLFVVTASSLEGVPTALYERTDPVWFSGYTPAEKVCIGRDHLVGEVLEEHGIPCDRFELSDEMLAKIVDEYTAESGVLGLRKKIAALARAASAEIVECDGDDPLIVTETTLEAVLGRRTTRHDTVKDENPAGVVTGLAWTSVGGKILYIETADMPGSGEMITTGQLGSVMKESARISMSLLKSRLPMDVDALKKRDIHIHLPSGATPKDGPSAGVALLSALASLATGIKVDSHLAMTGEITLRGDVKAIGGLKEKLYGAHRAGIKRVLVPKDNEPDLKDIPEDVLSEIEIVLVETVDDVLREALDIELPTMERELLHAPETQAA